MTLKKCKDCGQTKSVDDYYKSYSWYGSYCKSCTYIRSRKRILANPDKHKITQLKSESQPHCKYNRLKNSAKKRNLQVDLTYEEYLQFLNKPCAYCGEKISDLSIGVDRVDNKQGYKIDNLTPCCTRCNYIFQDYDKIETFKHIQKMLLKFNS